MFMAILVFQVLKSLVVTGIAYPTGGQVFGWSQTALYATTVGSDCVFMVLSSKIARTFTCLHWQNRFSWCQGAFWYVVEQLPWV